MLALAIPCLQASLQLAFWSFVSPPVPALLGVCGLPAARELLADAMTRHAAALVAAAQARYAEGNAGGLTRSASALYELGARLLLLQVRQRRWLYVGFTGTEHDSS